MRSQILPNNSKVTFGEKAALILGSGSSVFVQIIVASFTLYFLTDVLCISGTVAGTLFIVATIVEILVSPVMGGGLDKISTRFGKARPVLFISNLVMAVFAVLMFTAPDFGSTTAKIVWAYFAYIGLNLTMTLSRIAASLLPARISKDRAEITSVNSKIYLGGVIMSIIATVSIMGLLTYFAGSEGNMAKGYNSLAIFSALVLVVESVILFLVRERNVGATDDINADKSEYSTGTAIKVFFKNKAMVGWCLTTLVVLAGYYISANVLVYYCIYNLGDSNLYTPLAVIDYGATVIAAVALPFIVKRFEQRKVVIVSLILAAIAYALRYITGDSSVLLMCIFAFIASTTVGFYNLEFVPLVMDCSIASEYKEKIKIDGFFLSVFMVIMKVAQGIGGSIAGYALDAVNYVEGAAEQTPTVLNAIKFMSTGGNAVALAVGIIIFALTFKLKGADVEKMNLEIMNRTGSNTTET